MDVTWREASIWRRTERDGGLCCLMCRLAQEGLSLSKSSSVIFQCMSRNGVPASKYESVGPSSSHELQKVSINGDENTDLAMYFILDSIFF